MRCSGIQCVGLALILGLAGPAGRVFGASEEAGRASGFQEMEEALKARMLREGTNVALLYAAGDVCHDAGVAGDKKAVVRAEGYLRALLVLEPTNAPAMALLGSVFTMKGRDAFWPTTQLKLVAEGNEWMDKAVALAPDNVRARLTRALNNAHMPEFLGRSEIVRGDLTWLWERVESSPEIFSVSQKQQLALHWGRRLRKLGRPDDSRNVLQKGRDFGADTSLAREVADELSKLR